MGRVIDFTQTPFFKFPFTLARAWVVTAKSNNFIPELRY